MGRTAAVLSTLLLAALGVLGPTAAAGAAAAGEEPARPAIPVLAHYYQWFDSSSWDRAKTDYPSLGRYSSDDVDVMRRHVRMAKDAGITGFIVSWRSTPTNNTRLAALVEVARAANFNLAITYQGLDFARAPVPVDRVAADLQEFQTRYGDDPVFSILGRPLIIWSGTWAFSRDDIARTVEPLRGRLLILGSEKSLDGYERIADVVGGNAYYWSSVDPTTYPEFGAKLVEMGRRVHDRGGLWVAPFAPGFDARLVGGTRVVDRRAGETLRAEYSAAVASSPDALGLISWNEFSENTHLEPSTTHGTQYLDALGGITGATPAAAAGPLALDSSTTDAVDAVDAPVGAGPLVALAAAAVAVGAGAVWWRRRVVRTGSAGGPSGRVSWVRRWRLPLGLVTALAVAAALVVVAVRNRAEPAADAVDPAPLVGPPTRYYAGSRPARSTAEVVVGAAGDVACAPDAEGMGAEETKSPKACQGHVTANLLGSLDPDAVLALGDLQYPNGTLERFLGGYDTTWGRFKPLTYPVPGNHEYGTRDAQGYYEYFGPAAADPGAGYYSYDIGVWHVVALNSECKRIGGCGAGSLQEQWLRADLASHPARCTLAYWHRPRFSSGHHGNNADTEALWAALHAAGAELVLTGHDHDYERFAPMGPDGAIDAETGIRQFVVGTGGDSFYRFQRPVPGSEARTAFTSGVLRLTLRPDSYEWEFVAEPGAAVGDHGDGTCH